MINFERLIVLFCSLIAICTSSQFHHSHGVSKDVSSDLELLIQGIQKISVSSSEEHKTPSEMALDIARQCQELRSKAERIRHTIYSCPNLSSENMRRMLLEVASVIAYADSIINSAEF